jgi:hypothetical protein
MEDGEGNGGSLIPYSLLGMGSDPCNCNRQLPIVVLPSFSFDARRTTNNSACPIEPFRAKKDDEDGQDAKRG